MVTAQEHKIDQQPSGPICPNCGCVCEVRNFSTGSMQLTSKGTTDNYKDDFRCYCLNCGEYVDDPTIEHDGFEDIFDVPF